MGIYFNPEPGQSVEVPSLEAVRLLQRQLLAAGVEQGVPTRDAFHAEAARSLRLFVQQTAANFPLGLPRSR